MTVIDVHDLGSGRFSLRPGGDPIRFDGPPFARGWLSVALASGQDEALPALDRTVAVEHYPGSGVRLVATDRYAPLTAWVPELGAQFLDEPALDEAPARTVVSRDQDGRGRGLRAARELEVSVEDLPPAFGGLELRLSRPFRAEIDG